MYWNSISFNTSTYFSIRTLNKHNFPFENYISHKYLANYKRFDSSYKTQISLSPKKEHYNTPVNTSPDRLRYEYTHNPSSLRFSKHGSFLMT